jgi:hypothetical protein
MLFPYKGEALTNNEQTRIDFGVNYVQHQTNTNMTNDTLSDNKCDAPKIWDDYIHIAKEGACVRMSAIIEGWDPRDENSLFNIWSTFAAKYINTRKANLNVLFARFNCAYKQAHNQADIDKLSYDLELLSIFSGHLVKVYSEFVQQNKRKRRAQ